MRILQVHNFYQQPGGEDQVYAAEFDLLTRHGQEVEQYAVHNDAIRSQPAALVALQTIWSGAGYRALTEVIQRFRPDIVHCHNTFPLISPAVYYAAQAAGVPVAQTVQNYRLICPSATLLRDGHVCEDCVGRFVPYPGIQHGCYRGSRFATAAVAAMLTAHRLAGTWKHQVHAYIAPTEFVKSKLVEGGLPAPKLLVKPNFLASDPGAGSGAGGYALFVGRLAPEKGLATLLRAWRELPRIALKIVGDGPLREFVTAEAAKLPNVEVLGFHRRAEVLEFVKSAALLVVPSEWYEGFPMTVVEAMGCGTPVLASDLGSLGEVVQDGLNGALFLPGNSDDLASRVQQLFAHPATLQDLRASVRLLFHEKYSSEPNYRLLREIYRRISK